MVSKKPTTEYVCRRLELCASSLASANCDACTSNNLRNCEYAIGLWVKECNQRSKSPWTHHFLFFIRHIFQMPVSICFILLASQYEPMLSVSKFVVSTFDLGRAPFDHHFSGTILNKCGLFQCIGKPMLPLDQKGIFLLGLLWYRKGLLYIEPIWAHALVKPGCPKNYSVFSILELIPHIEYGEET